jgi:predicted Zn finger-like uncharacterized protein
MLRIERRGLRLKGRGPEPVWRVTCGGEEMRLVCPNCDAEYEVDVAAIPVGGRDVQCSACGHSWFQLPEEDEAARQDEAALYDPLPEAEPSPLVADPPEAEDTVLAALAAGPVTAPRGLDENLMAVLKEEAERETAARKAEADRAEGLETQTEMPLAGSAATAAAAVVGPATAALRKIAKLRGEPEPALPVPDKSDPTRSRRELLPAIEEINSTLRAASEKREADQGAVADTLSTEPARSGGFRRGFLTVLVLVILASALYIAAPLLAAKVPALAGIMTAYVQAVDAGRVGLDDLAKALIAKLSGLTGGQG